MEQGGDHALAGPGEPGARGAQAGASFQANLRLLREEDLGLAATGRLKRDLWWWTHLEGETG